MSDSDEGGESAGVGGGDGAGRSGTGAGRLIPPRSDSAFEPSICMVNAQGRKQPGWLARNFSEKISPNRGAAKTCLITLAFDGNRKSSKVKTRDQLECWAAELERLRFGSIEKSSN